MRSCDRVAASEVRIGVGHLPGNTHGFCTAEVKGSNEGEGEGVTYPGDLLLPELVNRTTESVKAICKILEQKEWGPEVVKELEGVNFFLSAYLVNLVLLRIGEKDEDKAMSFFLWAREKSGAKLSLRTYIALLECLGRLRSLEKTKQVMELVQKDGYKKRAWPYNTCLKWFSDNVEDGMYFWSLMKTNGCKHTVVTYTRMINVLAINGRTEEAYSIFKEMLENDCPPNITTYNVLIQALGAGGKLDAADELFGKLSQVGCKPNEDTYRLLITMHQNAGQTETALSYYHKLERSDLAVAGEIYEALQLPQPSTTVDCQGQEGRESVKKTKTAATSMEPRKLVAYLDGSRGKSVEERLDKLKPKIFPKYVVKVMKRLKDPQSLLGFFEWAKKQPGYKHNAYTYSMMISTMGRVKCGEEVERILKEMYEEGIVINTQIFTALITCYGRVKSLTGALQIFQQMKDSGCKPDTVAYTSLIHLLSKHGEQEKAREIFEEMKQVGCPPNAHTYSVLIYNYVSSGDISAALDLLKRMPELGWKPTPVTYATVIHKCAKDNQIDLATEVLSMMEKDGLTPLKATVQDLDLMYKRAGRHLEAEQVRRKLKGNRVWDDTFKIPTQNVARDVVFKRLPGEKSSEVALA